MNSWISQMPYVGRKEFCCKSMPLVADCEEMRPQRFGFFGLFMYSSMCEKYITYAMRQVVMLGQSLVVWTLNASGETGQKHGNLRTATNYTLLAEPFRAMAKVAKSQVPTTTPDASQHSRVWKHLSRAAFGCFGSRGRAGSGAKGRLHKLSITVLCASCLLQQRTGRP